MFPVRFLTATGHVTTLFPASFFSLTVCSLMLKWSFSLPLLCFFWTTVFTLVKSLSHPRHKGRTFFFFFLIPHRYTAYLIVQIDNHLLIPAVVPRTIFCSAFWDQLQMGQRLRTFCLHLPNDLVIINFLWKPLNQGKIWLCSGLVKACRFGKESPRTWLLCVEMGVGWISSEIWRRVWSALIHLHHLMWWCCWRPLVSILHGRLWTAAPLRPQEGENLFHFMALETA